MNISLGRWRGRLPFNRKTQFHVPVLETLLEAMLNVLSSWESVAEQLW